MKRLAHYALLAAILLGTPLLCCLIGGYDDILAGVREFPPRTENFGNRPDLLWNIRRPFNWGAFVGLASFTFLCLFPFLRRATRVVLKSFAKKDRPDRPGRSGPLCRTMRKGAWNEYHA